MNTSEVKKYSKGLVNSIKSGKITLEEAVIESSTKTGCTKDYARKILNDYLKSGYSNNPDYVGDWFGKGQIDFNAIINPEDDGDVWMVKMWSGSGYTLDVYLCKATNLYDAIDTVFEWSWENEGENNMVFDLDYVYKEADEYFESDPDMYGNGELDKEEYEDYFIQDQYVGDSNYELFARSENFFVDKVPENVLAENQKPVQNSRKPVKSSADNISRVRVNFDGNDTLIDLFEIVGVYDSTRHDYSIESFAEACKNVLGKGNVHTYISDKDTIIVETKYGVIELLPMDRGFESASDIKLNFDTMMIANSRRPVKSSRKPIKSANYNGFNLEVRRSYGKGNGYFTTYPVWDIDLDTSIGAIEYHYAVENPYYVAWVYDDFGVNKTGRTKAFDTEEECLEWIGGELASGTTARDKLLKYWEEIGYDYKSKNLNNSRKSNKRRPIKSMAAVSKNNRMDFKSLQNMAGMYLDREGIKFEESNNGLHVDQFGDININSETDSKTNRSQGRYSIELIPNAGDNDTYALFENAENDYYEGSSMDEFQEDMEDILREIFAVGRDNMRSIALSFGEDYNTDDLDTCYQFMLDAYPEFKVFVEDNEDVIKNNRKPVKSGLLDKAKGESVEQYREDIKRDVNRVINDVIYNYQEKLGITTGDSWTVIDDDRIADEVVTILKEQLEYKM